MLIKNTDKLKTAVRGVKTPASAIFTASTLMALSACGSGGSDTHQDTNDQTNDQDADTPTQGSTADALRSVNLTVRNANDTNLSSTDIDELNIVFEISASFDAKALAENAVINLGLTGVDQKVASLGRVDFDSLDANFTTLNIYADAPEIEIDYVKDSTGTLVINFTNDDAALTIGKGITTPGVGPEPENSIQLLNAQTVEIHHLTSQPTTVYGSILVDSYTTDLTITTSQLYGDIDVGDFGRTAAVKEGGQIENVLVAADYGNISLGAPGAFHGDGIFIDDATALQHYVVKGDNGAKVDLSAVGYVGLADDLETISLHMTNGASAAQAGIYSPYGTVSELSIITSSDNSIDPSLEFTINFIQTQYVTGNYNIAVRDLWLGELANLNIDTRDGGSVALIDANFIVHEQIFTGSGNILIDASDSTVVGTASGNEPNPVPFEQLQVADATDHTGTRLFLDGEGHDIFYGSTQDDTVHFYHTDTPYNPLPTTKVYSGEYRDAGGDDLAIAEAPRYAILMVDGDAGTNDRYESYGGGFFRDTHRLEFQAGSGNDEVSFEGSVIEPFFLVPVLNNNVVIDFGDRIDGHVHVANFFGNSRYFTVSLDGLPGITNPNADYAMALDLTTPTIIDENATYILEDGTPGISGVISNYEDLEEVSTSLSQMFVGTMAEGDSTVFVIHNVNPTTSNPSDYYFYLYNEQDDGSNISASELEHFATFDMSNTSPLLTSVSFA